MNKEAIINKMEGIVGIEPRMKKVEFDSKTITVKFEDGRSLSIPLKYFPSLKKVPLESRKKYQIFDEGKALDVFECPEMFHVRDFLGIPKDYLN